MKKSALTVLIIGGCFAFLGMILAIISMRYVWFTVAGFILVFAALGMNKKKKKDPNEKRYVEVLSAQEEKKEDKDIFNVVPEAPIPEEIKEEPSENNCPACGALVGKSDKFCPSCGKKLSQEEKKNVKKYCTYCGHELSINARFCPSCGEEVMDNSLDGDKKL